MESYKDEEKQVKEEVFEEKMNEEISKEKNEKEVIENKTDEIKKEEKVQHRKSKKKIKIILISLIVFVLLLMSFSIVFALININNKNIIDGIKIDGIDVGGLSKEQAIEKISKEAENKTNINIPLKHEEYEEILSPKDIDVKFNVPEAVDKAYKIGRESNIFINNYQILMAMLLKTNIETEMNYSNDLLTKKINDIMAKLPNAVKEVTYSIEDNKLLVSKGTEGLSIKVKEFTENILSSIEKSNTKTILIPVENKKPDEINIDKIYQEVHVEAKDAYYTKDPFQIYPHINGIDFDKEKAKEIVKENKEEYEIELTITVPSITTDKIGTEAFPDLLSTFITKYDVGNVNRSTNLVLASNKINGTVLMPGEEFSYNKVVGKRTVEAGYKDAAIFEGGKVVDGLGGGICQISSTLYNAVLYSNLEVTHRINHQFPTSYIGLGKDATVAYGSIDFKFKNNRKYPIKIVCNSKNGIARVSIYGIKEEVEYEVEISTTVLQSYGYTTIYEDDPTMEVGKEKVLQKGGTGYKTVTYKTLKLNGNTVSKVELHRDTYDAMKKIIARGTKQVSVPTSNPSVSTTPTEPVTPAEPTTPSTPVAPTNSATPSTPTVPTNSATPSTPPTPSNSATSSTPVVPSNSATPSNEV